MTCSWGKCFEWEVCLRYRLLVYCAKTNCKDFLFLCRSICAPQPEIKQHWIDAGTAFIVHLRDLCVSYISNQTSFTILKSLKFSTFCHNCWPLSLSVPATHWGVSVVLEIQLFYDVYCNISFVSVVHGCLSYGTMNWWTCLVTRELGVPAEVR